MTSDHSFAAVSVYSLKLAKPMPKRLSCQYIERLFVSFGILADSRTQWKTSNNMEINGQTENSQKICIGNECSMERMHFLEFQMRYIFT